MLKLNQPQLAVYDDPQGPKFEGAFAPKQSHNPQMVKVVSYNIDDGKEVVQAARELRMYNPLRGSDFILLPDMYEYGTDKIAR